MVPSSGVSSRGRGLRILQIVLVLLIVGVWYRALREQWPHLVAYPWRVAGSSLVLALVALVMQMGVLALAWGHILKRMGATLPVCLGATTWLQAQIARYVPGSVWDVVGRAALSKRYAVPLRAVPTGALLEAALQVTAAALVLLATLLLFPTPASRPYLLWTVLGLAGVVTAILPPVFHRWVNAGLRFLKREPLPIRLGWRDMGGILSLYVLAHALQGGAFVLFTRGITHLGWGDMPLLAGSYIGAWLVGYIAVFAPTGIGVREGAFVLLLADRISFPAAAGAALGFRVWLTLRDLLAALLGLALSHACRRDH